MRILGALLVAAAGCVSGPLGRRPEAPASEARLEWGGVTIPVVCLKPEPGWYPVVFSHALAGDVGLLVGFDRGRFLHYHSIETDASFDVAFLDGDGRVVGQGRLRGRDDRGVTSAREARYALFLPDGWLVRHPGIERERVRLPAATAVCAVALPEVKAGGSTVRVEIANRTWQRMRGLMHRRALSAGEGMLFLYPYEFERGFFMLNTHLPLDIAYFDGRGRLLNVVSADPYPDPEQDPGVRLPSRGGALYVLEVAKGWFLERGLIDAFGRPSREVRLELPDEVQRLAREAE